MGSGQECLFIFVARLAQMHVHINQSGGDNAAGGVNPLRFDRGKAAGPAQLTNHARFDDEIEFRFQPIGRVNNRSVLHDYAHGLLPHRPFR